MSKLERLLEDKERKGLKTTASIGMNALFKSVKVLRQNTRNFSEVTRKKTWQTIRFSYFPFKCVMVKAVEFCIIKAACSLLNSAFVVVVVVCFC